MTAPTGSGHTISAVGCLKLAQLGHRAMSAIWTLWGGKQTLNYFREERLSAPIALLVGLRMSAFSVALGG